MPKSAPSEPALATPETPLSVEEAQRLVREGFATAEKRLNEVARSAERLIREAVDALSAQTRAHVGPAGESLDEAQRYVVERIKERPLTAALAGLGVGLLIGLLVAGRSE